MFDDRSTLMAMTRRDRSDSDARSGSSLLSIALVESIIEAMPLPVAIVEQRGEDVVAVEANRLARRWMDDGREAAHDTILRATIHSEPEVGLRVVPLPGADGVKRWVIVWQANHPRARCVLAVTRWKLTSRQVEVLVVVAGGAQNKVIAERLGLAENTIELHVTRLLAKAGVENRASLVAAFWTLE